MATHKPRKRFGQHFLTDHQVIERFVSLLAIKPGDALVEIGPGLGALTKPLAMACEHLDVIEIDRDAVKALAVIHQQYPHCHIHSADILRFDVKQLIKDNKPLRIVGNLPYNISSPLLFHLFQSIDTIKDMHFMLQKEVVERMAAEVNSSHYGRLSVMVQYYCQVTPLFEIPPSAFWPPPKVDSAYVRLVPRPDSQRTVHDPRLLTDVVRLAFNQRRKTLRNSLSTLISSQQLMAIDIDPQVRAQQLDVKSFAKIADFLYNNAALKAQ